MKQCYCGSPSTLHDVACPMNEADTITVTINGRAVVFERIDSPRSIVYANGDMRLATDGTIHMATVGDVGSGITSDHQSAIDSLINRANEWAPVLRELARIGGET